MLVLDFKNIKDPKQQLKFKDVYDFEKNEIKCEDFGIVKIKPKIYENNNSSIKYKKFDLEDPDYTNADDYVGKVFTSNSFGDFRILKLERTIYKNKRYYRYYTIQFIKTGYKKFNISKNLIERRAVKDLYYPSVGGLGFIENDYFTKLESRLYKTWRGILLRCYNSSESDYPYYEGKGLFVSNDWLNFRVFSKEVKYLANWDKWVTEPDKYYLSVKYLGSKCFSKDTCVWVHKKFLSTMKAKLFLVIRPEGNLEIGLTQSGYARENKLRKSGINDVLTGDIDNHEGFKFIYIKEDEYVYRYPLDYKLW